MYQTLTINLDHPAVHRMQLDVWIVANWSMFHGLIVVVIAIYLVKLKNVQWEALHSYREDLIPEGDEMYDDQWSDICTAMAWIDEAIK